MARNMKKDYLIKLKGIKTKNGFKVDLANYIYNPSTDNDYPGLMKITSETEEAYEVTKIYYYKHYNGTGEYIKQTYTSSKEEGAWHFVKGTKESTIENSNRFSMKKLIELCEKEVM